MLPSHDCVALVVELVDTRDLKSLGVRAVPVQVRPGAPSIKSKLSLANATLAQLVERNLAKVEVTSSNLVCRSKLKRLIRNDEPFLHLGDRKAI